MATASTSPHGSKPWPIPAGCSSPIRSMITCAKRPVRVYRARDVDARSLSAPAQPTPPLPDKPSIAVLPFANLSGDPEQEYFADGMVEEVITVLSRITWFFVIARNSSFTYKGQAADVAGYSRLMGADEEGTLERVNALRSLNM